MSLWEGPEKHGVLPAQTEALYRRTWRKETTFFQTSCIFWHQDVDFLTEPGVGAEEARTRDPWLTFPGQGLTSS